MNTSRRQAERADGWAVFILIGIVAFVTAVALAMREAHLYVNPDYGTAWLVAAAGSFAVLIGVLLRGQQIRQTLRGQQIRQTPPTRNEP